MERFIFILCLSVIWNFCAIADSGMEPKMGYVFPLEKQGDRILAKRAILMNENYILPKGSFLRGAFIPPDADDADVKKQARKERPNPAFSRQPNEKKLRLDKDPLTPYQRAALKRAMETVWREEVAFQAAFERWDRKQFQLIFQEPGKNEVRLKSFELPQGMLLAEMEGKIVVVSVENDSPAQSVGISGQTVLLSLNGRDFNGSLERFRKIYLEEKEAKQKTDRTLSFSILPPKQKTEKVVTIRLPRSLDVDVWSVIDATAEKETSLGGTKNTENVEGTEKSEQQNLSPSDP